QFGDQTLIADWELEESVIKFWQSTGCQIGWIAEEHPMLFNKNEVDFIGYLDGLDGSSVYKTNEDGRCGTMMSIYQAEDQTFAGYVGSLVMDYGSHKFGGNCSYIAAKGLGAWADPVTRGDYIQINVVPDDQLTRQMRRKLLAYADLYFESVRRATKKMTGIKFRYLQASMPYYVDLAQGYACLVVECTRKHSLEIASAYPLVHEAGGVIVDLASGQDLGGLDRSLAEASEQIIVSAPNLKIVDEITSQMSASY
ncbi:MAG TPA: inositol monophosphatase family protein, partial [bacterium]|nr:inositol monophosphatase family protein [bacterium]